MVVMYASGMGISFWLCALNVEYRDVTVLLPVVTQLWFFATPIIYPVSMVAPEWQTLYYLNPMALVVGGLRWAMTGTPAPPPEAWLISSVTAFVMLAAGYILFRRRQATFADLV
jgi:lipopolysaccharide transport system permease protein